MSRIISRYILRETLQAWAVVTLVLMVILLANQFASTLGQAASNHMSRGAVFVVLGLSSVQYLTFLLPVSAFLAILLALGRFYRDSEMYALLACGAGPGQIYRPLGAFGVVLAAVAAWLAMVVCPAALDRVQAITREARLQADLRSIEPGRFVPLGQLDAVIYAGAPGPNGRLANIFAARRTASGVEVIVAEQAWQQSSDDANVKILTFANGRRYDGQPGSRTFRTVDFAEHGIPYTLSAGKPAARSARAASMAELLGSSESRDVAELQWRFSVPLQILLLVLLAVPLAKASPRQGRFTGLSFGLLIFISYANLLGAARVWVERHRVPNVVGMWWVHALVLLAGVTLLVVRYGLWRPRRRPAAAAAP
jgi:lipopolysaccharide export system permease protein